MLKRCYDPYYINKKPTYINCYVCEEWHNFQNFAEWFYENYYTIKNEVMHLDKDILYKGNKFYSPQTCCFVPENLNSLFTKNDVIRGKYPIGVSWDKEKNKFVSTCSVYNFEINKKKNKHLGYFTNEYEAFISYKVEKESEIKRRADYYKDLLPKYIYNALNNYQVEIKD